MLHVLFFSFFLFFFCVHVQPFDNTGMMSGQGASAQLSISPSNVHIYTRSLYTFDRTFVLDRYPEPRAIYGETYRRIPRARCTRVNWLQLHRRIRTWTRKPTATISRNIHHIRDTVPGAPGTRKAAIPGIYVARQQCSGPSRWTAVDAVFFFL
ncbi:hypothetical protein VTN96DRAFT_8816 [Rasamsonia emersonii]